MTFDDSGPSITLSSESYNDENTHIFYLTAEYNGTPYTQEIILDVVMPSYCVHSLSYVSMQAPTYEIG